MLDVRAVIYQIFITLNLSYITADVIWRSCGKFFDLMLYIIMQTRSFGSTAFRPIFSHLRFTNKDKLLLNRKSAMMSKQPHFLAVTTFQWRPNMRLILLTNDLEYQQNYTSKNYNILDLCVLQHSLQHLNLLISNSTVPSINALKCNNINRIQWYSLIL